MTAPKVAVDLHFAHGVPLTISKINAYEMPSCDVIQRFQKLRIALNHVSKLVAR